jgi:hypothetical protein
MMQEGGCQKNDVRGMTIRGMLERCYQKDATRRMISES